MLAVVPDNASSKDLLVCSAGGELGNELYISALTPPVEQIIGAFAGRTKKRDTSNLTFKPGVLPSHVFETPILQIVPAPSSTKATSGSLYGPWIAIRTHAGTVICSISPSNCTPGQDYDLKLIFSVNRDSVGGGYQHSDVCFNPKRRSEALIVNRCGEVLSWRADTHTETWKREAQSCELISPALSNAAPRSRRDCFWRLAWGDDDTTAYLVSSTVLYRLDLQLKTREKLYEPNSAWNELTQHNFTSILTFNSSETSFPSIFASTTVSILVFHQTDPSRPILETKHNLTSDFSVALSKGVSQSDLKSISVVLSTLKERILVEHLFSTSLASSANISSSNSPNLLSSSLCSSTNPSAPPIFLDLRSLRGFDSWASEEGKPIMVLESGSRGGVWTRFLDFDDSSKEVGEKEDLVLLKRGNFLKELEENSDKVEDVGRFGGRETRIENFGGIYRAATNGTFFKSPPIEPEDYASLILEKMRQLAVEQHQTGKEKKKTTEEKLEIDLEVIKTSMDIAKPPVEAKHSYYSQFYLLAEPLRSSEEVKSALNKLSGAFSARTLPSMSLESFVQSHFCSSLALPQAPPDNAEDFNFEDEEQPEENLKAKRKELKKLEQSNTLSSRWDKTARKIAGKYLPSSEIRSHLSNSSEKKLESLEKSVVKSSDQVALDLLFASQLWLPRSLTAPGPAQQQVIEGISSNQMKENAWENDPTLQDPPPLHFSFLRPKVAEILEALPTDNDPRDRPINSRVHDDPVSAKRVYEQSLESSKRTRGDFEIDITELGVSKEVPASSIGARLLLAEWEIGTDPKDYVYHEPYQQIEAIKKGESRERVEETTPAPSDYRRSESIAPGTFGRSESIAPSSQRRSVAPPPIGTFSASQPLPYTTPARRSEGRESWTPASFRRDSRTPNIRLDSDSPAPFDRGEGSSSQPQATQSQSQSRSQAMASQIVPGRFGSRPTDSSKKRTDGKRKSAKKRKSGF